MLEKGLALAKAGRHGREVSVEGATAIGSGKLGSVGGQAGEGRTQMIKPLWVPQFILELEA